MKITDRRWKRALAANPASKEPEASELKRLAAVRVQRFVGHHKYHKVPGNFGGRRQQARRTKLVTAKVAMAGTTIKNKNPKPYAYIAARIRPKSVGLPSGAIAAMYPKMPSTETPIRANIKGERRTRSPAKAPTTTPIMTAQISISV
jgi:hypothetical protein